MIKEKDTSGLIMVLLVLLGIFLFFALIVGITKQVDKERNVQRMANDVCWTSVELFSWRDIKSNKTAAIVMGLKRNGTVVWKEVQEKKFPSSRIPMFEDEGGEYVGTISIEDGGIK